MKKRTRRIRANFEPDIRFEMAAPQAVPFRAVLGTELEQLRDRLLQEALAEGLNGNASIAIRWAARDAHALAGTLPFPSLFLPELFAEKARAALARAKRQAKIHERSRALMAEAV